MRVYVNRPYFLFLEWHFWPSSEYGYNSFCVAVLNDLASCYHFQHQYSDAERLYLHRLHRLKASPHSDQHEVLTGFWQSWCMNRDGLDFSLFCTVMNNLALMYTTAGRLYNAIDIYQQALEVAQCVSGTEVDISNGK